MEPPVNTAFVIVDPNKLALVKLAFVKFPPIKTELLKSNPVNIPPDKLTCGPKMYPLRIKYVDLGKLAGVPIRPEVERPLKSALVKFAPVTFKL